MHTFENLSTEEEAVLIKLLKDQVFQNLIGLGEWSLTEPEEEILWDIIRPLMKKRT